MRGKVGIFAALVLAVALALSALAGLGARPAELPEQGPWSIGLAYPEGGWSACLDDPALVDGVMTSDEPVSGVSVSTGPGATRADVQRVLDCLSANMTGGTVHVGAVG